MMSVSKFVNQVMSVIKWMMGVSKWVMSVIKRIMSKVISVNEWVMSVIMCMIDNDTRDFGNSLRTRINIYFFIVIYVFFPFQHLFQFFKILR